MTSLPSLAVAGAAFSKLDAGVAKLFPAGLDKGVSYPRSPPPSDELSEPETTKRRLDVQEALQVIREGTQVDSAAYVPLLQHCVINNSLRGIETVHAHAVKTAARDDLFAGTSLVNAYMKCGSPALARKIFDEMPQRNVVGWTMLISGYASNSLPGHAVKVFVELLDSGELPTKYSLGAALSACCTLYAAGLGRQIHGYTVKSCLESDPNMGNSICSFYAKCGDLDASLKAFRRIPAKTVISWTTVISGCADMGNAELGIDLFIDMLSGEAVVPNEFTLTSVLSLCCVARNLCLGKQIHAFCMKAGFDGTVPVKNSVMYMYLKCGQIEEATRLFDEMPTISEITWNAMIAGHAQMMSTAKDDMASNVSGLEALKVFVRLNRSDDAKPDLFSYSSILTVCSGLAALEQGEQLHAQATKTGFLADVVVSSALLNMYNKCGCPDEAKKVFSEMPKRTMVSWTSMLTGLAQQGLSKEAIELFEEMRAAGIRPNGVTFVGVLAACSQAGLDVEAHRYFKMMTQEYGIKPVADHCACMVDMFVRLGQLEAAFEFVESCGELAASEITWTILVAGCRSHGKQELGFYAAERLLDLRPKATETYVLLMNMYIAAGRWQDVARVRKMMKEEKVGFVRDRSWIAVKGKRYFFRADDKWHSRSNQIYETLDELVDKAKQSGYVPYEGFVGDQNMATPAAAKHHSEKVAVAFGMLSSPEGTPVRVVKNISMCRDCHALMKHLSVATKREIVVRDSKRLHRFSAGRCSCGDFSALL